MDSQQLDQQPVPPQEIQTGRVLALPKLQPKTRIPRIPCVLAGTLHPSDCQVRRGAFNHPVAVIDTRVSASGAIKVTFLIMSRNPPGSFRSTEKVTTNTAKQLWVLLNWSYQDRKEDSVMRTRFLVSCMYSITFDEDNDAELIKYPKRRRDDLKVDPDVLGILMTETDCLQYLNKDDEG